MSFLALSSAAVSYLAKMDIPSADDSYLAKVAVSSAAVPYQHGKGGYNPSRHILSDKDVYTNSRRFVSGKVGSSLGYHFLPRLPFPTSTTVSFLAKMAINSAAVS
jgi:hypothetical protein